MFLKLCYYYNLDCQYGKYPYLTEVYKNEFFKRVKFYKLEYPGGHGFRAELIAAECNKDIIIINRFEKYNDINDILNNINKAIENDEIKIKDKISYAFLITHLLKPFEKTIYIKSIKVLKNEKILVKIRDYDMNFKIVYSFFNNGKIEIDNIDEASRWLKYSPIISYF
jgi:hypothetical protein